jgi:hypothetical protein
VDTCAEALSLLVRIGSDRADELLTKFLLHDAEEAVRLTAARELSSRKPTAASVSAQQRALLNDQAATMRILLNNLWDARKDFPEGERLVKRAATDDASDEIRQMAHKLAAGAPSKG